MIDIEGCILVTDGIFDDITDEHRTHFFQELLNHYQHLSDDEVQFDVRNWLSQWPVIGHSDDKTIAALFRKNLQHTPHKLMDSKLGSTEIAHDKANKT